MARRKSRPTRASQHRAVVRKHRPLYDELLAYQGGGCALCGKPPKEARRHPMDHDHKTMELRGILCDFHNRILTGRWTPELLRAAADYLDDPPFRRMKEGA